MVEIPVILNSKNNGFTLCLGYFEGHL